MRVTVCLVVANIHFKLGKKAVEFALKLQIVIQDRDRYSHRYLNHLTTTAVILWVATVSKGLITILPSTLKLKINLIPIKISTLIYLFTMKSLIRKVLRCSLNPKRLNSKIIATLELVKISKHRKKEWKLGIPVKLLLIGPHKLLNNKS